ncbi:MULTISPECIES: hypothetical protein [Burkholderiaceae]|nr:MULTISPECIES: hypothetical protein [Burkholderiaceae]MBN3849563.1 hypothetical protein [Paraburkholderia sp. Ac-20342]
MLSCQNGVWTSSASIVLNGSDVGCMYIIGPASTPYDYRNCSAPVGTNS